jgi:hypothetical protein
MVFQNLLMDPDVIRQHKADKAGEALRRMIAVYRGQSQENDQILEACPIDLADSLINAMDECRMSMEQQRVFCLILANNLLTSVDSLYDGSIKKRFLEVKNGSEFR